MTPRFKGRFLANVRKINKIIQHFTWPNHVICQLSPADRFCTVSMYGLKNMFLDIAVLYQFMIGSCRDGNSMSLHTQWSKSVDMALDNEAVETVIWSSPENSSIDTSFSLPLSRNLFSIETT